MARAIILATAILLHLGMRPQWETVFIPDHGSFAIATIHDYRILGQLQNTP
jgi:hypothetical protein